MGKRLDAKLTPVTFLELAQAMDAAWTKLLGKKPSQNSLAVLLAQSALETGHWKSCYCYNLGNAKAGPSWSGDYCFYFADEIVSQAQAAQAYNLRAPRTDGRAGHNVELKMLPSGNVHVTLYPDHPWCRFRAFGTLAEGVDDYLRLLNKRFAGAWPALETGDPEQFVTMLRELHYFTASLDRYLPPVKKLHAMFAKALADQTESLADRSDAPRLPTSVDDRATLVPGARGPSVAEVQRILVNQGYTGLTGSGIFDEATVEAVELFQLQHVDSKGLPLRSDGKVGPKTWWALLNPSGDAQRSFLDSPHANGLTETRSKLLKLLDAEHAKPVFENPDGSNRSPDIDRYWPDASLRGNAWCCTFVSWALRETLGKLPINGKHHVGVQVMWVEAMQLGLGVERPKPGDVFIQIKSKGTGHTGFVVGVSEDGQSIYTCEGNCGNRLKYGLRPASSIHHYIDCIRDGQGDDFPRAKDIAPDDVADDGTR